MQHLSNLLTREWDVWPYNRSRGGLTTRVKGVNKTSKWVAKSATRLLDEDTASSTKPRSLPKIGTRVPMREGIGGRADSIKSEGASL